MPCPEASLAARLCWHASVIGIPGCVVSDARGESWLHSASMGRNVVSGERRRADRNPGLCRGRSAHDGLIVLAGQRHPATLAIAPCAPHLNNRVADLAQVAIALGLYQSDNRVTGGVVPVHAGRRAGTRLRKGLRVPLKRLQKERDGPRGRNDNSQARERTARPEGNIRLLGARQGDMNAWPHNEFSTYEFRMGGGRRNRGIARRLSTVRQANLNHVGLQQWLRSTGLTAAHNESGAPVQRVGEGAHSKETGLAKKNSHCAAEKEGAHFGGNKTPGFSVFKGNAARSAHCSGGRDER